MKLLPVLSGILVASILLFITYSLLITSIFTTENISYDSVAFNRLAETVLQQSAIKSMDDCTRHTKMINDVIVRMTQEPEEADSLCCPDGYCCPKYYKDVLASYSIEEKDFQYLREGLEETKLRSFYRSGDSVLFYVDGFVDSGWGYLYTSGKAGRDSVTILFSGHTVHLRKPLNEHWREVGIH